MKKQTILFLDNTYPQPYQVSTLKEQAIGGTESSVVKTAVILSGIFNVIVAQKFRQDVCIENENLSFVPKSKIYSLQPDFIIVLRKYPLLKQLYKQFPKARLFLWLHTYKNIEYVYKRIGLSKTKTTVICNSETHKKNTFKLLNSTVIAKVFSLFCKKVTVEFCYNPIDKPKQLNIKRDQNKLLFFSSPNKGLQQILKCFQGINKELPNLKLYIANPGYKPDSKQKLKENIVVLGSLPHREMMKHVSESLCVFYPQDTFAETFGLIYAEANAYGTPVLAHDIGSAKEILHENNHLIDANDINQIIDRIKSWQNNFPVVTYNNNFSDENILMQWTKLLH